MKVAFILALIALFAYLVRVWYRKTRSKKLVEQHNHSIGYDSSDAFFEEKEKGDRNMIDHNHSPTY